MYKYQGFVKCVPFSGIWRSSHLIVPGSLLKLGLDLNPDTVQTSYNRRGLYLTPITNFENYEHIPKLGIVGKVIQIIPFSFRV